MTTFGAAMFIAVALGAVQVFLIPRRLDVVTSANAKTERQFPLFQFAAKN